MKSYAGIGSRETPKEICDLMTQIATILQDKCSLRSGGADGADLAFEKGITNGNKEIYLPWYKFNNNNSSLYHISPKAMEIANNFHPAWDRLSDGAKKLMGRNTYQILGYNLHVELDPSSFVICWTKDGKASGGTGQAIRIAEAFNIPVYNLHNPIYRNLEFYKNIIHNVEN